MATEIKNAENVYTIHNGFIYTTDEAAYAKAWQAEKDGEAKRGRVSGETLEAWKEAGSPEITLPEKSTKSDGTEIIGHVVVRKILKDGSLSKAAPEKLEINRAMMREVRGPLRGRPSSDNWMECALKVIGDNDKVAPIEIVESNETTHVVEEAEDGSYTATKDKAGTETKLRKNNEVLSNRIAELERILAEREEAKG